MRKLSIGTPIQAKDKGHRDTEQTECQQPKLFRHLARPQTFFGVSS